ncbi:nischarin isoform X1 [Synchiropus splendidus]|uniref:nischarin isoform X1 n=1 Tax=Synchiropus splendidus TaxID=270530 RepID=UPI00237E6936|nr:nischarin isoform X1 [Synchiropus splendidus]
MEEDTFPEDDVERKVTVVGAELVDNYTVYIIEVQDGVHRWAVKHRYSDFHDLHEKLTAEKKVDRRLLPPKKILGKNSKTLVERRQKELEQYLQTLLQQFPQATPTHLANFLHFHLYEINGITAALAEELFHKGEQLLQAGEVFSLCPLQLYAVTQQLRLAKPTCCNGDAKTDLGHILDFTCRLRYLKIPGTRGPVGTSNIQESSLPFDLSFFKSLLQIEISDCSAQQIRGLSSLRSSLATLSVHNSTDTMKTILVPEASEFSQWEPEGSETGCPVTAVIPLWKNLTTVDMSHNCIRTIDSSVKLIPKVEFLDLSHNQLSSVENLQYLYNLVHVDLSYNCLQVLEAAHTRLGNIKTLSLAGNQLEKLTGLTKLYSLVNLDLSSNRLAQLEEIRNIGSLPCLEKINLSSNPMCIIPDYRTKVLAQFGDRAAEVCLDGNVTTEKELDTVEVLKAIQKAKEVKDRMSGSDKKISEETRLSAAVPSFISSTPPSTSHCSSSVLPPPPPAVAVTTPSSTSSSSCSTQLPACPSQEVSSKDFIAPPNTLPPVDAALTPARLTTNTHLQSADIIQVPVITVSDHTQREMCTSVSSLPTNVCYYCSQPSDSSCPSNSTCPLLPDDLVSLSFNKDFINQLSQKLGSHVTEQTNKADSDDVDDDGTEQIDESRTESTEVLPVVESTEVQCQSPGSRDGYFEMGLDDSVEELNSSPSVSHDLSPESSSNSHKELVRDNVEVGDESLQVNRVLWCYCVEVKQEVAQKVACLVLTEKLLGLLSGSNDFTWPPQSDVEGGKNPTSSDMLSKLTVSFLAPYSELLLLAHSRVPHSCLTLCLRGGQTHWFIFSEPRQLQQMQTELLTLVEMNLESTGSPQPIPRSLLNSWEVEESQGAAGGFLAHLTSSSATLDIHPLSNVLATEEGAGLPSLLFLTNRHLWVLKMDFKAILGDSTLSSVYKLIRVPLGSVVCLPRKTANTHSSDCSDPQEKNRSCHTLELLLGGQRLLLLLPLACDQRSFLEELIQRRASLDGLKMVALPRLCQPCQHQERQRQECSTCTDQCSCASTSRFLSTNSNSWDSSLPVDENQQSSHLVQGLSPGLKLLSGLGRHQLLTYFHKHIALSPAEEVKQLLWLSVVLYKSPETELTCCLILSNDTIYFLLEDSAASLSTALELSDSGDPSMSQCCCLTISLSELQSVNVGLFDQYFRVVGRSAEHIVCCLSRDSYGTSVFLQELMSALSLKQQLPPPEPSEQDFYSQFTNATTGKMHNYELVHSSRVKFVYPSEEEMGDLTFIVAERKTPVGAASSSLRSFNILLYLLVFQVQLPSQSTALSGTSSLPSTVSSPELHPRTLILTGTDVFLLDEDYVSYPLPDFAKEPPSRERYQLREGRRIRDLDRVLLGYQMYPQALTLVFDDLPGPDLLCHLTMDHFSTEGEEPQRRGGVVSAGAESEVQWCVFVPGADSRERLISLLARQWESLCSRELPVELTG